MSRRLQIVSLAALLAAALSLLSITVRVPFVAQGPGPTYDVLGQHNGRQIIAIDGFPTFPVSGHLNMTTVSVVDNLTLASAVWFWASGQRRVLPRESFYPSALPSEEIRRRNIEQFDSSEVAATAAALAELGLPTRVVVGALVDGSVAATALKVGDEIIAVAGRPVQSTADLADRLASSVPGQSVSIVYRRDNVQRQITVVLGATQNGPQGFLGVEPAEEPRDGDVEIYLDGIGGPSAGLMFALGIVDRLSPGELTGGRFVAGTGIIEPNGIVKPIDGVPFKMLEAHEVGAEVFLVPEGNCAEASAAAPPNLRLIRVTSLTDAVQGLDALREGRPTQSC